jgi:hypothetical protein
MKKALQSISKAVALSSVAMLMVGADTRAPRPKSGRLTWARKVVIWEIRLWPFCQMSFGFMSATASVGHPPPMRSIR